MSRPISEKSVDAATSAGVGTELDTGGRITASLFVVATNGDTGSDTVDVQLEVSMDGSNFTPLRDQDGNQVGSITISDFANPTGNDHPAAYVQVHGIAAENIRANVTDLTDAAGGDLEVDAWVSASSNDDAAKNYRDV